VDQIVSIPGAIGAVSSRVSSGLGSGIIGSMSVAVSAGAVVCNGIIHIYIYIHYAHVFNGNVDQ